MVVRQGFVTKQAGNQADNWHEHNKNRSASGGGGGGQRHLVFSFVMDTPTWISGLEGR
jgi:hypothetical protein